MNTKTKLIATTLAAALITTAGCVDSAEAERNAAVYAKKMGIKATGISCSDKDSDQDGYTSCDVVTPSGLILLQCAYGFFKSGCKQQTYR